MAGGSATLRLILPAAALGILSACHNLPDASGAAAAEVGKYDVYAAPGRLAKVAPDRRLNVRCSGQGSVTVLLESGLGYPSYSWRKVQPMVAGFARVCSYDRAGLGFSDAGPMPRSASASADDIARLVEAGAIKPPLLLVGGSLGGQIVRLYAFRHPDKVRGIVLVDPYAEGQYPAFAKIESSIAQELVEVAVEEKRCVEVLRAGLSGEEAEKQGCIQSPYSEFSPRLKAVVRQHNISAKNYEAAYSESLMLDTENEAAIARERRDLSPMPLIVLSATNEFTSPHFRDVRAALLAEKAKLHRKIASLSSAGEVRKVDAGHVIQTDTPDVVVRAIRDALKQMEADR